jgi:hypothetical protein
VDVGIVNGIWEQTQTYKAPRLGDLKRKAITRLEEHRLQTMDDGFTTSVRGSDSEFQSDALARTFLMGAAQMALLDPSATLNWTLSDDTEVTLNAAEIKAVVLAMHVNLHAVHAEMKAAKDTVKAATSRTQIITILKAVIPEKSAEPV